ncbi:hypothetical protein GWI33_001092 [Rhynchophorus ferrugineus]|uniref:Retinol dehydrogenase 11-like protein n=1 Tax=Rhynchophorus ferrugineus TaxID=354439 RepID=A0A834ISY2_RHYFE|nr:hypothetical protein GWI33_001092 [Rhynchophorus ferrugineus]
MGFWIVFIPSSLLVILLVKLYIKLTSARCESNVCLSGKTVIVTGANTGIGYETALDLAKRGAKVILACRNEEKAKAAVRNIIEETYNNNVSYRILDLGSLGSVRRFAEEINTTEERLDILINNAGLQMVPEISGLSDDGLHPVMQANYFGHFLLTHLLTDLLKKSSPSRIVNVSSMAAGHTTFNNLDELNSDASVYSIYSRSKLCNFLFTLELHERLKNTGITTYSLHPGVIYTEFTRNMPIVIKQVAEFVVKWFCKDAREGAQTTIHCAVAKDIEKYSGLYFADCKLASFPRKADMELAKSLWRLSEELVKLDKKYI